MINLLLTSVLLIFGSDIVRRKIRLGDRGSKATTLYHGGWAIVYCVFYLTLIIILYLVSIKIRYVSFVTGAKENLFYLFLSILFWYVLMKNHRFSVFVSKYFFW
jgi:hypothetical protein